MSARPEFAPNRQISSYRVKRRIGQGGYGDIYLVTDMRNNKDYAMKTEIIDAPKQAINHEVEFLYDLKSAYFPAIRGFGEEADIRYYVMDILGPSISTVRRNFPNHVLDIKLVLIIAEETLKMMRDLHSFGIVHRDIKPSNFLLRPRSNAPLCLIDFGLAKRHVDPATHRPFPPSTEKRFIGTLKYASPNAHKGMDLAPRDDLYSWFYSLIELVNGTLPWAAIKDKDECLRAKETIPIDKLCNNLPERFVAIYRCIQCLQYDNMPDYNRIFKLIHDARVAEKITLDGTEWATLLNANPGALEIVPQDTEQLVIKETMAEFTSRRTSSLTAALVGDDNTESHFCGHCNLI